MTPPNPLSRLCEQVGIGAAELSRRLGIDLLNASEVFSENPSEPLASALKVIARMGVELRLRGIDQFSFWIDRDTIDERFYDAAFRAAHGYLPAPRTIGDLRAMIHELHAKNVGSLADISDKLDQSMIPTAYGLRDWRRTTVHQFVKLPAGDKDQEPITPCPRIWSDWRTLVGQIIVTDLLPDPLAPLKYPVIITQTRARMYFSIRTPIPNVVVGWIIQSLEKIPWLIGRWGKSPPPGTAETSEEVN